MPFNSKYRHVYGDVPKPEKHYLDIQKPYTSGEGAYCDSNGKFIGISKAGGGGPVYIINHEKSGRSSAKHVLNVHKGKTLDFQFHPFIDTLIATASEDCSACVSQIPAGGLTENLKTPEVTFKGHLKKVHLLKWHPTANNILATCAWDKTVKLWNAETNDCVSTYQSCEDNTFSVDWNLDGSLLAVTTKKKMLRIFDPRKAETDVMKFESMDGTKSSKLFWVPKFNWIGSTGFSKQAKRMIRIWDLSKTDKPIFEWVVDQQSSVLMPKFDNDNNILYLAGKGDGSVFFNELVNDKRVFYTLGVYRDTEPQKGGGWVPKRALDTTKCEVARFLKLTRNAIVPVSFVVPRKTGADIFQADIYPDTTAGVPSLSADEYLKGENKPPVMKSMDPAKSGDGGAEAVKFVKKQSYTDLVKENEELKARIAELEKQLGEISGQDS